MNIPLADVLVTDLTQNVAGPYCTQILGDMGAQIVKIERPGRGDDARAWAPPYWGEESATFMAVNRAKRSLAVDIKAPEGRAVVERLMKRADVFVQSLHAGAIEELGLGWEQARTLNPRLVYCSITAFGTEGPRRDRPGYDPLMQAAGGIMSITGYPGQPPVRVPVSMVDMGTGMWAAMAIVAALRARDRSGRGLHISTALYDTALAWMAVPASQYFATGEVPGPQGSGTAMIAPYEAFPTRDAWVMIAAGSDALFVRASVALDCSPLIADPRFANNPSRVRHRTALIDALGAVTRELTAAEVLERLERAGVPCAPILAVDGVAADPQTAASGMFASAPHPRLPDYRAVPMPVRWNGARPAPGRVPPLLGEHSHAVLAELGYDRTATEELVARKIVQAHPAQAAP